MYNMDVYTVDIAGKESVHKHSFYIKAIGSLSNSIENTHLAVKIFAYTQSLIHNILERTRFSIQNCLVSSIV